MIDDVIPLNTCVIEREENENFDRYFGIVPDSDADSDTDDEDYNEESESDQTEVSEDLNIENDVANLSIENLPQNTRRASIRSEIFHEKNCYKCKKILENDPQKNLAVACENISCKKILCKKCQPKNFHISQDWFCLNHNK